MKARRDYILRQVADTYVLLPIGEATVNFDGMVKLNTTGAMIWRKMEQETTTDMLADMLAKEFGVSRECALEDVNSFVEILNCAGCIEE